MDQLPRPANEEDGRPSTEENHLNADPGRTEEDGRPAEEENQNVGASGRTTPKQPSRSENTIIFFYPLPQHIVCTESHLHCAWQSDANTPSSRKQSLLRHLRDIHNIQPTTIQRCTWCEADIGIRPMRHQCPIATTIVPDLNEYTFKCTYAGCTFSCSNRTGLRNHENKHKRDDIRAQHERGNSTEVPRNSQNEVVSTVPQDDDDSRNPLTVGDEVSINPQAEEDDEAISPQYEEDEETDSINSQQTLVLLAPELQDIPRSSPLTLESETSLEYPTQSSFENELNQSTQSSYEDALSQSTITEDTSSSFQATEEPIAAEEPYRPHSPDESIIQQDEGDVTIVSSLQNSSSQSQSSPSVQDEDDDLSVIEDAAENNDQHQNDEEESSQPSDFALEEFVEPLERQLRDTNWQEFEVLLENITEKVQQLQRIRMDPPAHRSTIDVEDCKVIQRLYKNNRRRAVRMIVDGESERCLIPQDEIKRHFEESFRAQPFDPNGLIHVPDAPEERNSAPVTPFLQSEIKSRLNKAENSSPGDDRITYRHWRSIDPECLILQLVFNICLKKRKIPAAWKVSRTILIPKEGDKMDIKNWRPIALCRTIYKLYTSCLTQRLRIWAQHSGIISKEQKGFMPHDGVIEHNYAIQNYLDHARNNKETVFIALLDLSNAFGSIPIQLVTEYLKKSGIGEEMLDVIRDIMSDTKTSIVTANGETEPLPVNRGVRQGCPISGFLFNAGIEPLIQKINEAGVQIQPGTHHHCLFYADDMTLIAKEKDNLQELINVASTSCDELGLSINPQKCKFINMSGLTPRGPIDASITIEGTEIQALREAEHTKFLGRPVGFNILKTGERLQEAGDKAEKILKSKLAPWQRIDAIKSFVLPSIIFPMRTWQYNKTQYSQFDTRIRPLLKKTLSLPTRAANEYLYGSTDAGACGIPIAAEDSDLFLIDTAFKLLTSPDDVIKRLAENESRRIARSRMNEESNEEDPVSIYMSEPELTIRSSVPQSLWTKARSASIRMEVKWSSNNNQRSLKIEEKTLTTDKRKEVASTIRNLKRSQRDVVLKQKPDQGKTFHCISADKASSAFIRDGKFTAFADWRFIHRARLNLLPLNAIRGRNQVGNRNCRRCRGANAFAETLPHVINHCMRHSSAMQHRHNSLIDRVKRTAQHLHWEVVHENQTIPGSNSNLRPDLVIKKGTEAIIIDATCTFENGEDAFDQAREEKTQKYADLARYLGETHTNVKVEPFVMGSLGAYDPKNSSLTRRIASRAFMKTFKILCVADVIRWSRMIYIEHLTGARQYEEQDREATR